MDEKTAHRPVLLGPALEALNVKPNGVYVDGTYGRGGHAAGILERLDERGTLWLFDRDDEAVAHARRLFGGDARCRVRRAPFSRIPRELEGAAVDGLLLDLGVSSPQLEAGGRGFSFSHDGPLDMRMDRDAGESARAWLLRAEPRDIERVLRRYGEERYARRIVQALVRAREAEQLPSTTRGLAVLVSAAVPRHEPGRHPATRTFQALRIQVNDELGELRRLLDCVRSVLAPGARLVIISFHSLEDRMVKRFMRDHSRVGELPPGVPVAPPERQPWLRVVGRARHPDGDEIAANPRARSAVMRVAERLQ